MSDATVKGGFWDTYTPGVYNFSSGDNPLKRRIAKLLDRESLKGLREIALTLDGVAPGQTALETHKRVSAGDIGTTPYSNLNGLRTIETVTDVNRITTAADVTEINTDLLAYPLEPTTYVTNLNKNPRGLPGTP